MSEKLSTVEATHPDMLKVFLQLGRTYLKLASTDAVTPDPMAPPARLDRNLVQKATDVLTKAVGVGIANEFVYKQEMGDAMFYLGYDWNCFNALKVIVIVRIALSEMGETKTAIEHFERSLKVFRYLHGKWSAPVARTLRQIALLFVRQRNAPGALQYLTMVIKAETRLHGQNSIQVADLLKTRGDVLLVGERYDEAERSLSDAIAVYEILFGQECPQISECRERLTRARDHIV